MTLKYCGKTVVVKGTVRVNKEGKVLLRDVTIDGEPKDHIWVNDNRSSRFKGIGVGVKVTFRAMSYEYIGLNDDCEQVTKIGYKPLNRIMRSL